MAVAAEKVPTLTVAFETALILILTLAGIGMGLRGTATPEVDAPTGLWSEVNIVAPASAEDPGPSSTEVDFWWLMDSHGLVRITANSYDAADPNGPREFTILLACGAMLDDILQLNGSSESDIEEFGDEAACGATAREEGMTPRQQAITATGGRLVVEGKPRGTWSDVSGGQRLARTPSIGWFSPQTAYVDLAPTSNAEAGLTAELSESLDSVTPPETASGDVLFSWGEGMLVDTVLQDPAVSWLTSRCPAAETVDEFDRCRGREEAERAAYPPDLRSGIARWTQLGGQEQAQWLTLGSGLFLGIAATLAIEWIRQGFRRRQRTSYSSASKTT